MDGLKHVRPGGGFAPTFPMFGKVSVNGNSAHPLFRALRSACPMPTVDGGQIMSRPGLISWGPVTGSDITWNFAKFLVDRNGRPVRRYSPSEAPSSIRDDIVALLGSETLPDLNGCTRRRDNGGHQRTIDEQQHSPATDKMALIGIASVATGVAVAAVASTLVLLTRLRQTTATTRSDSDQIPLQLQDE
mmetsp:Transcript_20495/g.44381  ORF Transcript_20495/g.44381 Transcript_20495/m.44381 type:complete len:189 (+) Transcript_20495:313-879(+)